MYIYLPSALRNQCSVTGSLEKHFDTFYQQRHLPGAGGSRKQVFCKIAHNRVQRGTVEVYIFPQRPLIEKRLGSKKKVILVKVPE